MQENEVTQGAYNWNDSDIAMARGTWNAAADSFNQWNTISLEEQCTWLLAFACHRQQAEDAMRERCLSAVAGEKVEAVPDDESDETYNRAIDDAFAAIRAATLSKEGEYE